MGLKAKLSVLTAVISVAVALASGASLIGHPAHLVSVLTLFAGGFGAGAGLTSALSKTHQGPPLGPSPPAARPSGPDDRRNAQDIL